MATKRPIRVGDKFSDGKHVWEVIETKPGGKLELFDKKRCYFQMRYHKDLKQWQRIPAPA